MDKRPYWRRVTVFFCWIKGVNEMESKDEKLALMNIDRKGRPYLEVSLRSDDEYFVHHIKI